MANLFSFLLFFFFFDTFQLRADGGSELHFTYPPWTDISLRGRAFSAFSGNIEYISLTPWQVVPILRAPPQASVGWATYNKVVPLWINSHSSHALANFTTHFVFFFSQLQGSGYGSGLTFFMAPFDLEPPVNATGPWLGLFNHTSDGNFSNRIVAVEFDTFKNLPFEMDNNHVGIDVNSVASKVNIPVSDGYLSNGKSWEAWVDYDGVAKKLGDRYPENESYTTSSSSELSRSRVQYRSWSCICFIVHV